MESGLRRLLLQQLVFAGLGGSSTLQIAIQGAPENNTSHGNGLRSSLSFVTYSETGTIAKARIRRGLRMATSSRSTT